MEPHSKLLCRIAHDAKRVVRGDAFPSMRDRRAVARYGGLTGSPDESGMKRREKGLARAGNARVRKGMRLSLPVLGAGVFPSGQLEL